MSEAPSPVSSPVDGTGAITSASQSASWLRIKLTELYAAEFRRLKSEFEKASLQATDEVTKCKSLHAELKDASASDLDRMDDLQDQLNSQKVKAESCTSQVREMNVRMTLLKKRFEQRLLKIGEKETKRDQVLSLLTDDELKAICKAAFDRLGKLLFVPHVDLASASARKFHSDRSTEGIYAINRSYCIEPGAILASDNEFEPFISYLQNHVNRFITIDGNVTQLCHHFVLAMLFWALDSFCARKNGECKLLLPYEVKDDIAGYTGYADYVIRINGQKLVFVIRVESASSLQCGLSKLLAAMDCNKLLELSSKSHGDSKYSWGIVTSAQEWQLVKLNHLTGECFLSDVFGPFSLCDFEPAPESEESETIKQSNLCKQIAGLLEEAVNE